LPVNEQFIKKRLPCGDENEMVIWYNVVKRMYARIADIQYVLIYYVEEIKE
jgi:hypothetical protein